MNTDLENQGLMPQSAPAEVQNQADLDAGCLELVQQLGFVAFVVFRSDRELYENAPIDD